MATTTSIGGARRGSAWSAAAALLVLLSACTNATGDNDIPPPSSTGRPDFACFQHPRNEIDLPKGNGRMSLRLPIGGYRQLRMPHGPDYAYTNPIVRGSAVTIDFLTRCPDGDKVARLTGVHAGVATVGAAYAPHDDAPPSYSWSARVTVTPGKPLPASPCAVEPPKQIYVWADSKPHHHINMRMGQDEKLRLKDPGERWSQPQTNNSQILRLTPVANCSGGVIADVRAVHPGRANLEVELDPGSPHGAGFLWEGTVTVRRN